MVQSKNTITITKSKKNMEYTFKGTPGPWSVDGFNTTGVIAKVNEVGWKHVCNCDYGYAAPEEHIELNTTNAHLIAAAPDLLEALINIEKWNVQQAIDQYGDASKADTWACVVEARKAIHKALNF